MPTLPEGYRAYLISVGCLCLLLSLLSGGSCWLSAYKIIFLGVGVKSVFEFVRTQLNSLLDEIRGLQYVTLLTTDNTYELAALAEERMRKRKLSERLSTVAALSTPEEYERRDMLVFYSSHGADSVFWLTFVFTLLLLNTAHAIAVPMSETFPLLFGAPAYVIYWTIIRISSLYLFKGCTH